MWSVLVLPKAIFALASGPEHSGNLEGPSSYWELSYKGTRGGFLGVSSLLRLANYLLSSWENKNISGFLFAEIITYRWLLGFVSRLEMRAVTVYPRVKCFFWACVSFHSITHSLPASISSSVLGSGFVIHLAYTMSCLLFLALRIRISSVIM